MGIFVNRNFSGISTVLVLLEDKSDDFLIRYAHRLLKNDPKVHVTFHDEHKLLSTEDSFKEQYKEFVRHYPDAVKLSKSKNGTGSFQKYSFMLISYQSWIRITEGDSNKLDSIPSTLIINKKESRFSKG